VSPEASAGVGSGADIAPTPSTSIKTSNSPNENIGLPDTPVTATTLHPKPPGVVRRLIFAG
jgi:hypothetical protein